MFKVGIFTHEKYFVNLLILSILNIVLVLKIDVQMAILLASKKSSNIWEGRNTCKLRDFKLWGYIIISSKTFRLTEFFHKIWIHYTFFWYHSWNISTKSDKIIEKKLLSTFPENVAVFRFPVYVYRRLTASGFTMAGNSVGKSVSVFCWIQPLKPT